MDKKKLLFISILLYCFSIYSYAQENNTVISKTNGIIARTNYCHTGLNTDLSFLRSIGKHSVEAGIKYHINTPIYDNRFHAFKHRFRTSSFIEHFGLTAGYTYNLNNA